MSRINRRFGATLLGFGLLTLLAACPPPPKQPDPTIAQVTIRAQGNANPNVAGQPSPTVVFVYALKPGAPFLTSASSEALLGGELGENADSITRIARIVIAPGKERKEVFTIPDDTARIGVAGSFRQQGEAAWRAEGSIQANSVTLLTATVGTNQITLE